VQGVDAQALRDNDALREQVAAQLTRVQRIVDGLVIDQPRRRIIRSSASGQGENHAPRR
jgi:hypothetical protein